ncbi:YozE family protein [Salinicoccus albus]|uniref:YozE family protein n=1 Tax=Salinicoccus albus TaxID=418756 RepID=UPI00035D6681|nr:sterile alpha motif-like domain-containing protein [Salinicoccus albus]
MKNYSFYHYIKTRRGEDSDVGSLAQHISTDTMFPKDATEYSEVSDYLERHPYEGVPLSIFDASYDDYKNWLEH